MSLAAEGQALRDLLRGTLEGGDDDGATILRKAAERTGHRQRGPHLAMVIA